MNFRNYRNEDRTVIFDVKRDVLTRTVVMPGPDDRSYTHRCTRAVFEAVAHAMDERGDRGATAAELVEELNAPSTQVNVALQFLQERGCVTVEGRRSYAASSGVHLDAMTEFCFLAELPY